MTNPERRNSKKKLLVEGKHKAKNWRPPELEDQPWFPTILRSYQMAFLSALDRITRLYAPVNKLIADLDPKSIVDLATGSGQSIVNATKDLDKEDIKISLTDKYPTTETTGPAIDQLDILTEAYPEADLYTIFNAYHHFDREERLQIALKATAKGGRFIIIEPLQPSVIPFIKVVFATLLGPILLAPFMRPFSWKWLVLTYLIPLGILVTLWDGVASVIKSLSEEEWDHLEQELTANRRRVEQGFLTSQSTSLKYFLVSPL